MNRAALMVGGTFSDKESRVFKIGEKDNGLVFDFNSEDRTVEIARKRPIKYRYVTKVRISKDGSNWCYAGGETMQDLHPIYLAWKFETLK